MTLAKCAAWVG